MPTTKKTGPVFVYHLRLPTVQGQTIRSILLSNAGMYPAKLLGLPAKKGSLESKLFEVVDRKEGPSEAEEGQVRETRPGRSLAWTKKWYAWCVHTVLHEGFRKYAGWYCHVKASPYKAEQPMEVSWRTVGGLLPENCKQHQHPLHVRETPTTLHPYIATENHQHQQRDTSRTNQLRVQEIRRDATLSLLFTKKWKAC